MLTSSLGDCKRRIKWVFEQRTVNVYSKRKENWERLANKHKSA
jgi:hypothetical protein